MNEKKIDLEPFALEGRVVRLAPLSEEYIPDLAEVGLEPTIWRHLMYGNVDSTEKLAVFVRLMLTKRAAGTDFPFAVLLQHTGKAIGCTRYMNINMQDRGLEIGGTWYGLAYQRTAVNTECKYLLLRHAFEAWGCIRVQLKTDLNNVRSQVAIERLGAVKEGVMRNHMVRADGTYRHSVMYSIIDSEWPAVRSRLDGFLGTEKIGLST